MNKCVVKIGTMKNTTGPGYNVPDAIFFKPKLLVLSVVCRPPLDRTTLH
jgi:hypothetical protein